MLAGRVECNTPHLASTYVYGGQVWSYDDDDDDGRPKWSKEMAKRKV